VQLARNAVSIYQDPVEGHGFAHRYNAVKGVVARLRARVPEGKSWRLKEAAARQNAKATGQR